MKRLFSSPIPLVLMLSLPVLGFSWYVATRNVDEASLLDTDPSILRNRTRLVGGVERPLSDIADPGTKEFAPLIKDPLREERSVTQVLGENRCPKTRVMTRGQNKQMDSLIEALETHQFPERLSPWIPGPAFDRDAWKNNPRTYTAVRKEASEPKSATSDKRVAAKNRFFVQAEGGDTSYLDVAEPGRIYDTAQPEGDTPPLKAVLNGGGQIVEGESFELQVQTLPSAPASFTIFGNGVFENGIGCITVVADEQGVARASYTGTHGPGVADIVAGSPLASGTIRFQVIVTLPAPSE